MEAIVYLDESGDLGWKFNSPYNGDGSSRYLTLAALVVPTHKSQVPKRTIKKLYKEFGWKPNSEKKWSSMKPNEKDSFIDKSISLVEKHPDIYYYGISVYKPNVMPHIREDSNKLYNYMTKLMLLDAIKEYKKVTFIPDARSIKVKSGNSLSDYLQTELWFEKKVETKLIHIPYDSSICKGIQFADMLCGAIQQHYENNQTQPFQKLCSHITLKKLYHY